MTTQIPSTLINWVNPPSAPSQTAKYVFAAPNASGGVPAFRQLVVSDILGIGTAASVNTGTSGATIPLLNAANTWAAAQVFSVRPTFNGNTPWDNGNLPTPASNGAAGSFTTLQASGAITPAYPAGIVGNITGSGVSAGRVGELPTPGNGVSVALTTGVQTNITSITLTAGDWDVYGNVYFTPAGSTILQAMMAGLNTTSATLPGATTGNLSQLNITLAAGAPGSLIAPSQPITVSSTTTVYLVGQAVFSTSTLTASGRIWARRR